MIIMEMVMFMVIVMVTVLIVQGVRKVPMSLPSEWQVDEVKQLLQRCVRQYLPIKVNASGVMPIIFAQAIMTVTNHADSIRGWWFHLFWLR
jgi:preprotein translocase subunit SecY